MKMKTMKKPIYKIYDDYLDRGPFHNIQSIFFGNSIEWIYNEHKVNYTDDDLYNFQFVHKFWEQTKGVVSPHWSVLTPLVRKLDPALFIRVKANMVPFQKDIVEYGKHVDTHYKATTAIFYLNTNNGYTCFTDGSKVESVANRLVTFPSHYLHAGTTCTDEKVRGVLNLNYVEKKDIQFEKEI